jgi:hypothetical protein
MISAFQSREFDFGMALDKEQLGEVNKYHEGKFYIDKEAAMATRQSKQKWPLNMIFFLCLIIHVGMIRKEQMD